MKTILKPIQEDTPNSDLHLIPLEIKGILDDNAQVNEYFTNCIEDKEIKEINEKVKKVSFVGHQLFGKEFAIENYNRRLLYYKN